MAFEALQEKFSRIVKTIKGESKLTEKNMEAMLSSYCPFRSRCKL